MALTVKQKKAAAYTLLMRLFADVTPLLVNDRQFELVNDFRDNLLADYDSEISFNSKMEQIKSL
jgi:hypothetical protein